MWWDPIPSLEPGKTLVMVSGRSKQRKWCGVFCLLCFLWHSPLEFTVLWWMELATYRGHMEVHTDSISQMFPGPAITYLILEVQIVICQKGDCWFWGHIIWVLHSKKSSFLGSLPKQERQQTNKYIIQRVTGGQCRKYQLVFLEEHFTPQQLA